ncbi:MAG: hypothetical protein Q4E11_05165 [Corynebacterium sp.]|uniref:hypothetical protein n=1 Tax=Corynebacterium sp. TaxID=1720 RepID=UPI0026DA6E43|nr:hypothetical protein [Corynebacterium sp.]MDO5029958.1 hypothetical protein [Corynebacterium sp.]
MQSFISWFTSQSGVSLIVALIALGGVLINNAGAESRRKKDQTAADQRRKADQAAEDARRKADDDRRERERSEDRRAEDARRKAEQDAADQRRKADQAAEDARRKADDDRRERERLEQLQREDWARQRRAVADCIREITKSAALVSERAAAVHTQGDRDIERAKLVKAVELARFNVEATNQLTLLDIEITQPHVSAQLHVLWEQIVNDYQPLAEAQKRGGQEWINQAEKMPPLSDLALHGIRALTIIARIALLEYPEHMETQPVKPIDLGDFYDDSRVKKDDNHRSYQR